MPVPWHYHENEPKSQGIVCPHPGTTKTLELVILNARPPALSQLIYNWLRHIRPFNGVYIYQVCMVIAGFQYGMFPSMSMMTLMAGNPMPMTQATWNGEPNEKTAKEPKIKSRKRKRSPSPQVSMEEESSDSEDEDPDAYYLSTPKVVHKTVQEFMGKFFYRCIPKRKRLDLAKLYPKPDLPESADISDHNDLQLAKVQATILASSAPATNFWSHLLETELTGKEDMIPASEVIKVLKDTLALLGNASNYVSQARRRALTQMINKSRPRLGSFLKDVCKDNLGNTGTELFGVEVRKRSQKEPQQLKTSTRPWLQ